MAVVEHSDVECWLRNLYDLISPTFTRAEPRQRAWNYMCGLVGKAEDSGDGRRSLASYVDEQRGDGAQRLLTTAQWNESEVRAILLDLVKQHFGLAGGKLYVTEATFVKKGSHAVGVERQFSVDYRRMMNCQIAILMFYAAPDGSLILVDAVPYLPAGWLADAKRRKASIPDNVGYRSKSYIAADMVGRTVGAGVEPERSLFSLLCKEKISLRGALQARGIPYMMSLTTGRSKDIRGAEVNGSRAGLADRAFPARGLPGVFEVGGAVRSVAVGW